MAFKKNRNMKVHGTSGYRYKATPTIMLKGEWLKELGFEIGDYVSVCCENGKLVITQDAEMAAMKEAAKGAGYDPYEKKLLGITAMTALMGKKKFEEVLGSYITKPQGKPALVPESDKRPAINTAYEDFSEN